MSRAGGVIRAGLRMTTPTPTLRRVRALAAAVALAVLLLGCLAPAGRAANGPLWTAVVDPAAYYGAPDGWEVTGYPGPPRLVTPPA